MYNILVITAVNCKVKKASQSFCVSILYVTFIFWQFFATEVKILYEMTNFAVCQCTNTHKTLLFVTF